MKSNDELFTLIKSLDKNEKGYISKFSKLHGNKGEGNYIKLLNCMARMDEYSDSKLREKLKGEKMLGHLSVTKHYLKNLIIRALRNYYEEQTPFLRNISEMGDTYVMLKKGLLTGARKKILKEKEASVTNDSYPETMQWIRLQEHLFNAEGGSRKPTTTSELLFQEKKAAAERYINHSSYVYLGYLANWSGIIDGKVQVDVITRLLKDPLLSSPKMALSSSARMLYTQVLYFVYDLRDEPEKGKQVLHDMISYCEDPKNRYKPIPFNFFLLQNYLLNLSGQEDANAMQPIIEKGRKFVADNRNNMDPLYESMALAAFYQHEMRMHLFLHKPEQALKTAARLDEFLRYHPTLLEDKMISLDLKAIAYLNLKKPGDALECLNQIFVSEFSGRNDLLGEAYAMNIIAHLELRNYAIIKRQVSIAENFIKKYFPESKLALNLVKVLAKAAKLIEAGDKKGLRNLAPEIYKIVEAKKIGQQGYIKDWFKSKLD